MPLTIFVCGRATLKPLFELLLQTQAKLGKRKNLGRILLKFFERRTFAVSSKKEAECKCDGWSEERDERTTIFL